MRSYLKYLLIILPLMVSLALPCAAKRQIKQHLNAENLHLATKKGENARLCISTFVKNEQVQQSNKRLITDFPYLFPISLSLPSFNVSGDIVNVWEKSDDTIDIPLFLLYRKMLIYF